MYRSFWLRFKFQKHIAGTWFLKAVLDASARYVVDVEYYKSSD